MRINENERTRRNFSLITPFERKFRSKFNHRTSLYRYLPSCRHSFVSGFTLRRPIPRTDHLRTQNDKRNWLRFAAERLKWRRLSACKREKGGGDCRFYPANLSIRYIQFPFDPPSNPPFSTNNAFDSYEAKNEHCCLPTSLSRNYEIFIQRPFRALNLVQRARPDNILPGIE